MVHLLSLQVPECFGASYCIQYFSFVKNRSCVTQICITKTAAKCILVVVVKWGVMGHLHDDVISLQVPECLEASYCIQYFFFCEGYICITQIAAKCILVVVVKWGVMGHLHDDVISLQVPECLEASYCIQYFCEEPLVRDTVA